MDDKYDLELRGVVRKYSIKVAEENPDDPLSQALGSVARRETEDDLVEGKPERVVSWETWIKFQSIGSDGDGEDAKLKQQCKKLSEAWEKFHAHFDLGSIDQVRGIPPRIDALQAAVQEAEKAWTARKESGFGKAKSGFESFMSTMNDYSFLFSVLPSEDRYFSLITGTISSIVKASVNHRKITEGFASALENISQELRTVKKSSKISDNGEMRYHVVRLYVALFEFLCHAMEWFRKPSRRLLYSIDKNYYEKRVQNSVEEIKKILGNIRLNAEQTTQARIQHTQQGIVTVQDQIRDLKMTGDRRYEDLVSKLEGIALGFVAQLQLLATAQHDQYDRPRVLEKATSMLPNSERSRHFLGMEEELKTSHDSLGTPEPAVMRREDLELLASPLEVYLENERKEALNGSTGMPDNMLPLDVVISIQTWIREASSKMLWVQGPLNVESEDKLTLAAVRICYLVLQTCLPCVSFFARPRYAFQPPAASGAARTATAPSPREASMTALLYSMVAQLVHLLPEEFDCPAHLRAPETYQRMDGTPASHAAALDLIESLMAHAPPTLIFVLDRVHFAVGPTTAPHLIRLIELLRESGKGDGRVVKVLFTTAGACQPLARCLQTSEMIDAEGMDQARPGQPLRGWSSLD